MALDQSTGLGLAQGLSTSDHDLPMVGHDRSTGLGLVPLIESAETRGMDQEGKLAAASAADAGLEEEALRFY